MKTILSASLVLAVLAFGGVALAGEAPAEAAVEPRPEAKADAEAKPAEEKPADVKDAKAEPAKSDAPRADQAQLVEGAPLGNASVHVHIMQKKPYINEGRHEIALYPGVLQINGKFTQHYGIALMYAYHLSENLAIQVTPVWNYWNQESDFNQELITKGGQTAIAATAMLVEYGAVAGLEITPIYGKFALYQGTLAHFSFVLNFGAGVAKTRVELRSDQTTGCGPNTDKPECQTALFGDTGLKPMGSLGGGFRVFLGDRAAIRLEVRDLIYTARVDKINGCDYTDFTNIMNRQAPINSSCPADGGISILDANLAANMVKDPSSDVINNISFYAGFSFLF